jgi:DNA-binding GntR family transcriptional regulator
MKDLDVGRTPVREALRQLDAEGLITIVPRKGATVNKISLRDVEEYYIIGGTLESKAASLSVPNLDDKTVKRLIKKNEQIRNMQKKNQLEGYCKRNAEFHQILIDHCGNKRLIKLVENLRRPIYRFRLISFAVPGRIEKSIEEHENIVECVLKKDPLAVRNAMEQHWNHKRDMLIKYLDELSLLSQ